ncbi:MAG: BatA domain-containing protein [Gemmatimonadetes bacterium]|nr:BatA domain-containing protein [Gemmatimonadota bacterium]
MSFLAPAFLAGLGLLLIPVIIHLTQRQRSRVTVFPSLMFLRKVPFKTTNRRRIRHPLLFALRCLGIGLLAVAFARPFFERASGPAGDASRDVVLLLDTSASLGFGDRWSRALDEARSVVSELAVGDRAAIVTFEEDATERSGLTEDLIAVGALLDDLELTDRATRIDAGLQVSSRILDESDRSVREVVLISDFQRTAWEDGGRVRLPDGVTLRAVNLSETAAENVAVADARLQGGAADRARVLVRLANMGESAVEGLPVSLELGGRAVATIPVDLAPRGAGTIAFDDVAIPEGRTRARVTIRPDGLAVDDALRFMASADEALETLVVEGARGRADRSLFVERALSIGEAPRIRASRRGIGGLDAAALAAVQLVIVNDADLSDAGRAGRLRDWVTEGGGLLIALGPNTNVGSWAEAGRELLGGEVGSTADRSGRGGSRLSWLDYDHPVFEIFSTPRSGDFSEARFFRFRGFTPGPDARVIARYEGGEPALVEGLVGEGRVLVWTSSLDRFWNDLALQPVFLPFLHRVALHATGYREPERWVATGDVLELAALAGDDVVVDGDWVLVNPAGDRAPIERTDGPTWIEFDRAGFYSVEAPDGSATVTVAVNPELRESDLTPIAPERVSESVVGAGAGGDPSTPTPGSEVTEARPVELWWVLVALAAVALAAESIVANRWTRRRPASGLARSA